jgi:hypothetical protein
MGRADYSGSVQDQTYSAVTHDGSAGHYRHIIDSLALTCPKYLYHKLI